MLAAVFLLPAGQKGPSPVPPPTPAPTGAPTAAPTPAPTASPAITASPVRTVTVTGADVTAGQPSLDLQTREDLIAMLRWMIHTGTDSVALQALAVPREAIRDVADKYSNYIESFGYNTDPAGIRVSFKPGVRVLNALRSGTEADLPVAERAMAERAVAIVSELVKPGMSPEEAELAVYNYVGNHCEYPAVADAEGAGSARGFFENGLCTCAGYVDTFRLLASLAGLEVEMIGGPTDRDLPGAKGHAWNLIRLDGVWYALDLTWDDRLGGGSEVEHVFFNLPYNAFADGRSSDASCCPPGEYAAEVDGRYYFAGEATRAGSVESAVEKGLAQLEAKGTAWLWLPESADGEAVCRAMEAQYSGGLRWVDLSEQLKLNVIRVIPG